MLSKYTMPGLGATAVQVDIGHPELVLEEPEAANRRKMADWILRNRRSSLPGLTRHWKGRQSLDRDDIVSEIGRLR